MRLKPMLINIFIEKKNKKIKKKEREKERN